MVSFDKMGEFVDDDIVDDKHRRLDQPPVEADVILDGTGTPAITAVHDLDPGNIDAKFAVEHPGDQALLSIGAAAAVREVIHRTGIGIGPAVEVLLAMGGDGAELGFVAAGGDHDLVVIKQRRAALIGGA